MKGALLDRIVKVVPLRARYASTSGSILGTAFHSTTSIDASGGELVEIVGVIAIRTLENSPGDVGGLAVGDLLRAFGVGSGGRIAEMEEMPRSAVRAFIEDPIVVLAVLKEVCSQDTLGRSRVRRH